MKKTCLIFVAASFSFLLVPAPVRAQDVAAPEAPGGTRLLFGPTARALPKGQVYFGVYEFLMPFVQVGVTDRISIGGGTPLFIGIDESHRPFWVTPKVQALHGESTDVAVGVLHVSMPGEGGGGVGYVVATHGSQRGSLTTGVGLGYDVDGGRAAVVMIGGEQQVRPGLKIISENYVWKGGSGIATAGVRFSGDRLSADVGLGIPIGLGETFAFPVINFVYNF
jgi:hypothetical protein